jgi:hypothetical protein
MTKQVLRQTTFDGLDVFLYVTIDDVAASDAFGIRVSHVLSEDELTKYLTERGVPPDEIGRLILQARKDRF